MTDIETYLTVANAYGPTLSPDGDRLAYLTDRTGRLQVWLATSRTDRTQLTTADTPTAFVSWSPTRSDLVIGRSPRAENQNLFRLSVPDGTVTPLTDQPDAMHRWGGWASDGERFAFTANRRTSDAFDVYVQRVTDSSARRVHETDGWHDVAGWGPDGDRLLLVGGVSRFDTELYVLDVESGTRDHVTPFDEAIQLSGLNWGPDGKAVYLVTDYDADTRYVARLDVHEKTLTPVVTGGDWPIDGMTLDPDSRRIMYGRNVNGYTEVTVGRLADSTTVTDRRQIDMPPSVMGDAALAPGGERAAVTATNRTTPPNVFLLDTVSGDTTQWTTAGTLPETAFVTPETIEYETHDGRTVPALFTVPEVGSPPYPAIVDLHGGPDDQRRPSLLPTRQYFVAAGYALFEPNVRGSTGYGREYAALDDGRNRLDAVEDVRCGAAWLADRPSIDADRLGVLGASYGGYLALMTLTTHPSIWQAGVTKSGIVNLVTYLNRTAAWRRSLRIEEYGDPETDAAFLREASPISSLDALDAPVLVVHGAEDPRVPVSEVRQLEDAASTHVETLVFDEEGHGITDPENKRLAFQQIAEFFEDHL